MIGILTFHWADDCGAMLQCYALKSYLNQYRKTVLVPYVPKPLRSRYRIFLYDRNAGFLRRIYRSAKELLHKSFYRRMKTKVKMRRFRRAYLTKSCRMLYTPQEIAAFGKDIDTFVAGSDQIWNPDITEGFQEGYFCTFRKWTDGRARCVSYAASIGAERLAERHRETFTKLLANFDSVSLREPSAKPYVEMCFGKRLSLVLDPVFLLERKQWEALAKRQERNKKKYALVYYNEYNAGMEKFLGSLERETGCEIWSMHAGKGRYPWTGNTKYIYGKGPAEFLGLLWQAEYVVTNSFHATAFSVIFHKQFAVFAHSVRNARMGDLLHTLHLEERMLQEGDGVAVMDQRIDWDVAEHALQGEIARSREYIEEEILMMHE